ncbi:kinase-like protein [Hesseltinella vesiculosa]|uniref:Kinase-like protein n=1 Tax=Hesseltinella vesiculosa TaxID=101127 RepID=A0A1X2GH48_9FUNG|nr:kinase-like protein [Hesseltinella vesiculosa]
MPSSKSSSCSNSRTNSPPESPLSRSRSNSVKKNVWPDSPNLQHSHLRNHYDHILSRLPSLHHHDDDNTFDLSNKPADYALKEPIGYGSSAVVYEAIYKPTQRRVAIKVIDLDMFERNQIDELRRETALMALSKHPNVLRVCGSYVQGSKLHIVTPFLSAGSCLDIMKSSFPDGFDEVSIVAILKQALEALLYLHKNGHIHRDVKAGNLLMDESGTVQLADFGVSSSLTENSEVRKTFVGTPCWMAPEVMEQSGYDFKADIWSFGITAIELATGHAPFAKYPPMKVLMMTLSNDPPTLPRETASHKFSKMFQDMVESCLRKDPKKRQVLHKKITGQLTFCSRPTAEKLLANPFFKQARKKEYLTKTILAHVPALDKRPHKRVPQKHISFEAADQWDFDNESDGDTESTSTAANNNHKPSKKHISFGNVVIKNPSTSSTSSNVGSQPSSPVMPHASPKAASPDLVMPTPQRKSRFIINDPNQTNTSTETTNGSTTLSQRSTSSINEQSIPRVTAAMFSPEQATLTSEVKKGRFSVNSTGSARSMSAAPIPNAPANGSNHAVFAVPHPPESSSATVGTLSTPAYASQFAQPPLDTATIPIPVPILDNGSTPNAVSSAPNDIRPAPVSRVGSNDSIRKSRFAVHVDTSSTGPGPSTPSKPHIAAVEIHRQTSKAGRFSIESEDHSSHSSADLTKKKSRFHISDAHDSPPLSSTSSSVYSPNSSLSRGAKLLPDPTLPNVVYAHMENLYKQTETQRILLQDLLTNLSLLPAQHAPSSTPAPPAASASAANWFHHFQHPTNPAAPASAIAHHFAPQHSQAFPSSAPTMSNLSGSTISSPAAHGVPLPHTSTRNRSPSIHTDMIATMDHLHNLLQTSQREKDRLLRENEALKKELDKYKRTSSKNITSPLATAIPVHPKQANGLMIEEAAVDPLPPAPLYQSSLSSAIRSHSISSPGHDSSLLQDPAHTHPNGTKSNPPTAPCSPHLLPTQDPLLPTPSSSSTPHPPAPES